MLEFLVSELTRYDAHPALAADGRRLRRAGAELVTVVSILGETPLVMPPSALQDGRSDGGLVCV